MGEGWPSKAPLRPCRQKLPATAIINAAITVCSRSPHGHHASMPPSEGGSDAGNAGRGRRLSEGAPGRRDRGARGTYDVGEIQDGDHLALHCAFQLKKDADRFAAALQATAIGRYPGFAS